MEKLIVGAMLFMGVSFLSSPAQAAWETATVHNPTNKQILEGWSPSKDFTIYNPSPVQGGVR